VATTSVAPVRAALAEALGPDAHVEHRANHTGAGKLSFAVRRGAERLWARVAADDDEEWALTTWSRVAAVLAERHAGPPVLDVLEVLGRTTLVLPHLDAPVATRSVLHARRAEARAVLDGLHADAALADLLGPTSSVAASFHRVWVARFTEDLRVVDGYLEGAAHAYLAAEVDVLSDLVAGLDGWCRSAVHGDPWHENWLAGPDRLWLLDWEDLSVGCPAVDHAVLLADAVGLAPSDWPDDPAYVVARRALLLDRALDVAADWVEARDPLVRRRKEAAYLAGLEAYRAAFG
jgi:hypothetical protein